jgi:hypothetical protein
MPEQFTITGTVRVGDGLDFAGVRVVAYDRDLPSRERRGGMGPQLLGDGVVDADGRFSIEVDAARFLEGEGDPAAGLVVRRVGGPGPDVTFRVVDRAGNELELRMVTAAGQDVRPEQILFNATSPLEVVLTVEAPPDPGHDGAVSEYETLKARIAPVAGDLSLADLADDDLEFLVHELGLDQSPEDRDRLGFLRAAEFLGRVEGVAAPAFYGWARMGVPDLWPQLPSLDDPDRRDTFFGDLLDGFAATDGAALGDALRHAAEHRIIPAGFGERADALSRLVRRRTRAAVTARVRLLSAADGARLAGYTAAVFDDGDEGRDLGEHLTDARGDLGVTYYADPKEVAASRPLRWQISGPGLATPVDVTAPVTPPTADETETGDGADAAAAVIRVPMPAAAPSVRALAADGHVQLSAATLDRLDTAGIGSYADIRRGGGLAGVPALADADPNEVRRLDALTELDRLTADPVEASALLALGYDSVIAIADTPWNTFLTAAAPQPEGQGADHQEGEGRQFLSYERAVKLRAAAQAQAGALDILLAGIAADLANGFSL